MANSFKLAYCSDCGEARVPHFLNKLEFYVNPVLSAFLSPFVWLTNTAVGIALAHDADRLVLPSFRFLSRIGLGSLKERLDGRDSIRTKSLFEGAEAAGIKLYQFRFFDQGHDGILVAVDGQKSLVFSIMPRPRLFHSPTLAWMDDKGRLKPFLQSHQIPTAEGGIARSLAEARTIFDRIGPPVITKPHLGTRGRHTTIGIRTPEELAHAIAVALQITPTVIVEKELSGIVHRVTLIGGKTAAVAKRDYPHVVGDGHSTVEALLEKENEDPRRNDFDFYKIARNERAEEELRKQGKSWDSVPASGERVILNDKVSRLHGTVTQDVTDLVHPDNLALFDRIADVMGDPLIGVDFMIGDVAVPWTEQPGCGLIECNAMPYIDLHHYVYEGPKRNVAKLLWEHVFAAGTYQKPAKSRMPETQPAQ